MVYCYAVANFHSCLFTFLTEHPGSSWSHGALVILLFRACPFFRFLGCSIGCFVGKLNKCQTLEGSCYDILVKIFLFNFSFALTSLAIIWFLHRFLLKESEVRTTVVMLLWMISLLCQDIVKVSKSVVVTVHMWCKMICMVIWNKCIFFFFFQYPQHHHQQQPRPVRKHLPLL